MSWLTDAEQNKLLEGEPGPITDRINRRITIALRQMEQRRQELEEERLRNLENKVAEHEGFITTLLRGLTGIVKAR